MDTSKKVVDSGKKIKNIGKYIQKENSIQVV